MSTAQDDLFLTIDEYFRLEQSSQQRHEYVAGRIFAMVGTTAAHNVIVSNLVHFLYEPVRKRGCQAFSNDIKLKVEAARSFYYPDVMVTCEKFAADTLYMTAPCVVFEVLSPSTMDIDRREKLSVYQHLPSLREYVVVYQNKMHIELYRKGAGGSWHCTEFSEPAPLPLSVAGESISLDIADIYAGLDFGSECL